MTRTPVYKFDSAMFLQEGSLVSLFDPRRIYVYDHRVMQFVVDDISDLLLQAEEDRVIPVMSSAYKVVIFPWDENDYECDIHVTVDIYNRVKAILETFGYRPSNVKDRRDPVLTDCMPDLEHCIFNLTLRVGRLESASLSRV